MRLNFTRATMVCILMTTQIASCLQALAYSDVTDAQGLGYTIVSDGDNYTATVTEISPDATHIVIPSIITGKYGDETVTANVDYVDGNLFEGHTNLRSVTFNGHCLFDGKFANCTSLETVSKLPDHWSNELPSEMFYNCNKFKIGDLSWLPVSYTKLGERCFATDEVTESGNITIPANIIEISASFENRIFDKATYTHSETELKGGNIDARILNIERLGSIWIGELTEEIYNLQYPINGLNIEEYNDYKLRKLEVHHAIYENECCITGKLLETADISGCDTPHGIKIIDCPALKNLILPDKVSSGLSISRIGECDITFPTVAGQGIFIYDAGCNKIDLSNLIEAPTDNEDNNFTISIQECSNLTEIHYPEFYNGKVDYSFCPSLKDVYIGPNITKYMPRENGKHDVVFAGDADHWCEMEFNSASLDEIGYDESLGNLNEVDHLWVGHKTKMTCLTDLTLNKASKVSEGALSGYERLTSIHANSNVKFVGLGAFHSCTNLKTIEIDCDSIGAMGFYKTPAVETIRLGNKLQTILAAAFERCGNEQTKVNYLGTADQWCKIDFTNVIGRLPDGKPWYWVNIYSSISPTAIAKGGFYFNGKLAEEIVFNSIIDTMPESVLEGLESLKSITFYGKYPTEFGYKSLAYCPNLTKISLTEPQSAQRKSAFTDTSISVGDYAFVDDAKLSEIGFIADLTKAGTDSFKNTAWLTSQAEGTVYAGKVLLCYKGIAPDNTVLKVLEGTTSIADKALSNQTGIIEIKMPQSLMTIGNDALCGSLTGTLRYPGAITEIRSWFNAPGITSVVFEDGDTEVEFVQNVNFENLKEIYVGRNFKCVNYYMQYQVEKLTFGSAFSNMNKDFFGSNNCENLKCIRVLQDVPPTLETYQDWIYDNTTSEYVECTITPFHNLNQKNITLEVPEGSVDKYKAAEGWKDFFNIVSMASIEKVNDESMIIEGYYNTQGLFSDKPFNGFNIIVYKDGRKKKVLL